MLLTSARVKFGRAQRHRNELMTAALDWLQVFEQLPVPIEKRTEPWQDGEVVTYSVAKAQHVPPLEIAGILGDALNDYRAALDHLAWQLVSAAGPPRKAGQIYFPVAKTSTQFEEDESRMVPGVSSLVSSMIRRHQPFQNGSQAEDHPLFVLHEWNRLDKHRSLHLMAAFPAEIRATVPGTYPNFRVMHQERRETIDVFMPGTDLIRIYGKRIDPREDTGVSVLFRGRITLGHESGRGIERAINLIDGAVDGVLTEFERLP